MLGTAVAPTVEGRGAGKHGAQGPQEGPPPSSIAVGADPPHLLVVPLGPISEGEEGDKAISSLPCPFVLPLARGRDPRVIYCGDFSDMSSPLLYIL